MLEVKVSPDIVWAAIEVGLIVPSFFGKRVSRTTQNVNKFLPGACLLNGFRPTAEPLAQCALVDAHGQGDRLLFKRIGGVFLE